MKRGFISLGLGVLLSQVAGCGASYEAETVSQEVPEPVIESSALDAEETGAISVPVTVNYAFDSAPVAGNPLVVGIEITATDVSDAFLTLRASGQISLSENMPERIALQDFASVAASETVEAVINVAADGRSELNLQITGVHGSRRFTKASAIPIYVGASGPVLEVDGVAVDDGVEVLTAQPSIKASPAKP